MSPGTPDREVIDRHLSALDAAVTRLRRHAGRAVDDLRSDPDEVWAIERGLQLCAQNVLDIATHLVASAGRESAEYAAAIDMLADLGVLPPDFAARLRGIAGFRNVLVHGYLEVDLARVHQVLNERLDDFTEFARLVQEYLRRR
jgi:uncharacterized protein YutE (UPF0331/DUF86 family)